MAYQQPKNHMMGISFNGLNPRNIIRQLKQEVALCRLHRKPLDPHLFERIQTEFKALCTPYQKETYLKLLIELAINTKNHHFTYQLHQLLTHKIRLPFNLEILLNKFEQVLYSQQNGSIYATTPNKTHQAITPPPTTTIPLTAEQPSLPF